MSKIATLFGLIKEDNKQIGSAIMRNVGNSRISHFIPDKIYLKMMYRLCLGHKLDLKNPKTFNEKLQWLKLYDRKSKYVQLVDKYEVKKYIADIIGEQYVIPALGIWNSVEEIDFESLPERFVLKCTHDSGSTIICRDKTKFDFESAKKELKNKQKNNMFWWGREWPYKHVKPRIIAEQYMEDKQTSELRDYKFFCFDGVAKLMFVATERQKDGVEVKFDFFDMEFNHLDFRQGHPNACVCPVKPEKFEEMRRLSEKLSKNIPHVRVDFYEENGRILFGEFTFYNLAGMVPFEPQEWDYKFGEWIKLPKSIK